jgi:predicted metal-binding membrane protein
LFVFGYLAVWVAFAAAATTLQWALDEAGLLSETMAFGNIVLAGSVLIAAGVYQWTPLKEACLRHCRSPLDFLLFHWHDGALGAVVSGIRHGLFCLGCCWMLMALLFVGGIMNLAWIAVRSQCVPQPPRHCRPVLWRATTRSFSMTCSTCRSRRS